MFRLNNPKPSDICYNLHTTQHVSNHEVDSSRGHQQSADGGYRTQLP